MPAKSLSALLQSSINDDHDEILQACDASLKQSKKDTELHHIKCVALIKLDRYEDALRVLEEGGQELKDIACIERAYALYKVGDLAEAKKIASGIANDRGSRHIEAQAVRVSFCSKDDTDTR